MNSGESKTRMKTKLLFTWGPQSSVSWDTFQSKLFVFGENGEERGLIITRADLITNLIAKTEPTTSTEIEYVTVKRIHSLNKININGFF